ncbi:MAG: hypothetical protein HYS26_00055 [Candidatus Kaiserbacteria bacterium]|nr:MAG: hypothetical protein HYS26_00055 [Candidatus Kaiserbacteria bacterium]
MNFSVALKAAWRWIKWPLLVLLVIYIALVIWRIFDRQSEIDTQQIVAEIQSKRLTIADVDGSDLPPAPDPALADATIEGIDSNGNGIRDDVELAIFAKYPNDKKIRAAELQYAMALQMYLTKVMNTETWVAAVQQESRAYGCIFENASDPALENARKTSERVEGLVLNTDGRKSAYDRVEKKYTTSFGSTNGPDCDANR